MSKGFYSISVIKNFNERVYGHTVDTKREAIKSINSYLKNQYDSENEVLIKIEHYSYEDEDE